MPRGGARLGAGRPRKPGNEKKLTGTKGKGGREPQYAVGAPAVPSLIKDDPIALGEWRRKAALLTEQRVLTVADGTVLARYCLLYARLQRVRDEIALPTFRFVVFGPAGEKANPLITIETQTVRELRMIETELGLTPASRTRVATVAPETVQDPDAELLDALAGGKPQLALVRGGKGRKKR